MRTEAGPKKFERRKRVERRKRARPWIYPHLRRKETRILLKYLVWEYPVAMETVAISLAIAP